MSRATACWTNEVRLTGHCFDDDSEVIDPSCLAPTCLILFVLRPVASFVRSIVLGGDDVLLDEDDEAVASQKSN